MSYIFKWIMMLSILFSAKSYSQTWVGKSMLDSTTHKRLQTYIGERVSDFLLDDEIRCYTEFIFFDDKPFVLTGAMITFDSKTRVSIYVSEFKFVHQFDSDRVWDKKLFYKEIINGIKIYNGENCILDISK